MYTQGLGISNGHCCCSVRSVRHCRTRARCLQDPVRTDAKITTLGFMYVDVLHWGKGKGNQLELFRGRCLC